MRKGYRVSRFLIVFRISVSDLYGINVRPVAPVGSVSRRPYVDLAMIHRCLPDELLFEVLHFWTRFLFFFASNDIQIHNPHSAMNT